MKYVTVEGYFISTHVTRGTGFVQTEWKNDLGITQTLLGKVREGSGILSAFDKYPVRRP
jgi:hypothetical protein